MCEPVMHKLLSPSYQRIHRRDPTLLFIHTFNIISTSLSINVASGALMVQKIRLSHLSVRKVSCGKTADWIRMPFGVVSGVLVWVYEILVVIVEGEGAVWAVMAYLSIIDSCVKSWQYFPTQNVSFNSKEWLSYDIVRLKIELGVEEKFKCKNATKQTQHGDTPV